MAEEVIADVKVVGDWSEFDRQAQERARTFSTEGLRLGVGAAGGAASVGGSAQGQLGASSVGAAAEQIAQAFIRLIPGVIASMQQAGRALPSPSTASFQRFSGSPMPGETMLDSAVRHRRSGMTFTGGAHFEAFDAMGLSRGFDPIEYEGNYAASYQDLFVTSAGRMATRAQAAKTGVYAFPVWGTPAGPPPKRPSFRSGATGRFFQPPVVRQSSGIVPSDYDFDVQDAAWTPSGGGYGRLARQSGPRQPGRDWEDADWEPSSRALARRSDLATQGGRGLVHQPMEPEREVFEGEEVDEFGNAYGGGSGLAGGGGGPAGGGPGVTPPGGGARFWSPVGWGRGGGGGRGLTPPPFWARPFRRLRQAARGSFSRFAFYGAVFGLFEVGRAHRADVESDINTALATSPEEALRARFQGIEGVTRGVYGSIVGLGVDAAATLSGGAITGPSSLRVGLLTEIARSRSLDQSMQLYQRVTGDRAIRNAYATGGLYAMQVEQFNRQSINEQYNLRQSASFLRAQSTGKEQGYFAYFAQSLQEGIYGLFGKDVTRTRQIWARTEDYTLDPATRAALGTQASLQEQAAGNLAQQAQFQKQLLDHQTRLQEFTLRNRAGSAWRDSQFDISQHSRERFDLSDQQRIEYAQVQQQNPALLPQLRITQGNEMKALLARQGVETLGNQEATNYFVATSALRAARRPHEAALKEIQGRAVAETIANAFNPAAWPGIVMRMKASYGEENAAEAFTVATQSGVLSASIRSVNATLARQPLEAARQALAAERIAAIAAIPLDRPGIIEETKTLFSKKKDELEQDYRIRRHLESETLGLQEQVSGILATAYGPGANRTRRRAQIAQTVGETEITAERLLLNDMTDTANADRVRKIGINQLKSQRAEYLQGFQAQEGSLFRTNLSQKGTSDGPETVLKDIKQGIDRLTARIGKLVAVP